MSADPNGHGDPRIHADHARFLYEQGYRVMPPDHDDFLRGESVEAENDVFIAKRHAQREAAGEPEGAAALWAESAQRYEAARKAAALRVRREYHVGQARRLRGVLGSLVAHHEREAERFDRLVRDAA